MDEEYPWSPKLIDNGTKKSKLDKFKHMVALAVVCDHFTSPDGLGFKIASCIGRHLSHTSPKMEVIKRLLKIRVHQAYFLQSPILFYFINATNLSLNRALEITHVWYEDENSHIAVVNYSSRLPVRSEIDESWERWVAAQNIPEFFRLDAFGNFRMRISTGGV